MSTTLIFMALAIAAGFFFMRQGSFFGASVPAVSAREAAELINSQGACLLDVREADEYAAVRIPSSRHIPLRQIRSRLSELETCKTRPIVVSCRSGSRSARACSMLRKEGFENVYNLHGGLRAWALADLTVER